MGDNRTTYYGLYLQNDAYLVSSQTFDLSKEFTFEFFLRIDQAIENDNYYLFSKVTSNPSIFSLCLQSYITETFTNGTFKNGYHYYGFSFAANNSAYFFINNTAMKQYCKAYFPNFFEPDLDFMTWIYVGVSVSEFSSYSTNVCAYKRGWNVQANCKVLLCTMTSHLSDHKWYIGGKSFTGVIKSMYIWKYAKAINTLNQSPSLGLRTKDDDESIETKRKCEAFDPNGDDIFIGYCPVCDKYSKTEANTCNTLCPLNMVDDLCTAKCVNDLCVTCTGISPSDCQVCKEGAIINSTSGYCEPIYETHYLAPDKQSCLRCSARCYGCTGDNYTNCYGC